MNSASVTVVIPTFNSGALLVEAIRSVLFQTVPVSEIIVVDDGSTDCTVERLAPFRDRIRYAHQSNQGVSTARNLGMATATQEYVAFLDADDYWHPRKIELQMQTFALHPTLGMLGSGFFSWPAVEIPTLEPPPQIEFVSWDQLVVKNNLVTSSILAKRHFLERAGPFDKSIQGPEDRDMWLRVAEFAPIANLPLPLVGYRDVLGSVSKQAVRCEAGMIRILKKLDERRIWAGRAKLRRRAYSYAYHSSAYTHGAAGSYARALACSLKSLGWYPFPYARSEVKVVGERPKRFIVNLLRSVGLKSTDATSQ